MMSTKTAPTTPIPPPVMAEPLRPETVEHNWTHAGIPISIRHHAGQLDRYVPLINHALDVNLPVFKAAPPKLAITVVSDEMHWEQAAEKYAALRFAWGVTHDDGRVVLKTSEFSGMDPGRMGMLTDHEVNHSFWVWNFGQRGLGWSPFWVAEGIANLIAPARDLITPTEISQLYEMRDFSPADLEFGEKTLSGPHEVIRYYSLWRAVVGQIQSEGKLENLFRAILSIGEKPTKRAFEAAFEREFGCLLTNYFRQTMAIFANRENSGI